MVSIMHDQVVDAIMSENEDLLRQCVQNGLCDVSTGYTLANEPEVRRGWTPLHLACFQVKPIAAKILLEIEGPFEEDSERGISELRVCLLGHIRNSEQVHEIITLILQNGIDVTRLEDDFHNLIRNSNRKVIRIFLRNSHFFRHPSNFARHPFASLPDVRRSAQARMYLIDTFETLMTCTHVHEADRSGHTALFVIADRVREIGGNAFLMIQRLLERRVNPNVRDPGTNLTAFSTIVRFRRFMGADMDALRLRIASFLIANGAEFEVPDPTETHPQTISREMSWYEKVYAIDPRRPLAMACAWHPRLGHASEIQRLPTELQRTIYNMAFEEYHRMHQIP